MSRTTEDEASAYLSNDSGSTCFAGSMPLQPFLFAQQKRLWRAGESSLLVSLPAPGHQRCFSNKTHFVLSSLILFLSTGCIQVSNSLFVFWIYLSNFFGSCFQMYRYVPVYRYVVCTGMYWYELVCTGMCLHVLVHTYRLKYVLV